jgi:hypothetical protein
MSLLTQNASNLYSDIDDLKLVQFSKNLIKLITNLARETFKYFTVWAIILAFLFYIGKLEYYQNSLLLISVIVSIWGFTLIYYYPRYFKLPYFDFEITRENHQLAKFVDLMIHQAPLILILLKYKSGAKSDPLILGLVISCLYLIFNNPNKVYGFKCNNCANNSENDVYRCYITCFSVNLGVIILVLSLLGKLLYLLQNNKN